MTQQRIELAEPDSDFSRDLYTVVDTIYQMMLDKNRKYGDSALNPKRVFSKASSIEQINVRLDDKLSRLMSGKLDDTEDVELDLVGYILLKRVAKLRGCTE
jgi:hypothetical protein